MLTDNEIYIVKEYSRKITFLEEHISKLTEENEAWQKQLITTEEKSGKAYYDLACEVENLRAENQNLHASCTELTRKCASLTEENERLRADNEILKMPRATIFEIADAFDRGRKKGEADTVQKLADSIWDGELDSLNISVGKKFYNKQEFIDETAKKLLEGKQ